MIRKISAVHINNSKDILLSSFNGSFINNNINSDSLINTILFIVLICVSIPSIFINLFALYRLNSNKKTSAFNFRTILHVSLFTTCTCVPLYLIELHFNSYFPLSPFICKIWLIIDYASIVCLGLVVCWTSIQRHILIFGPIQIKKRQSTLKFKLIPSILALGLPITWYSLLASTCTYDKTLDTTFECRPCFEDEKFIFLLDTIFSLILPLSITITATCFLVVRLVRLRLTVLHLPSKRWRRCKRLTCQVILFSSIYLIGLVPYVLTNLNSLYNFWPLLNRTWCVKIANAFTYVPCCFSSFLSIYAFPEIWINQKTNRHHKINQKCNTTAISTNNITSTVISSEI
ncbi:unnamed protein product [Adineta steineri]|uniref:G-protein coupled receptors family 1 profile domain-containing protein n=1 Tax=Adineta steineri TaxID=433720 RepID=A0A818VZN4_9BILA|nr:unnamed protein product [Adineta steineri]CAF3718262.1 unnamed protein product [Adineta steineri]